MLSCRPASHEKLESRYLQIWHEGYFAYTYFCVQILLQTLGDGKLYIQMVPMHESSIGMIRSTAMVMGASHIFTKHAACHPAQDGTVILIIMTVMPYYDFQMWLSCICKSYNINVQCVQKASRRPHYSR